VRALNQSCTSPNAREGGSHILRCSNPGGAHSIAVGINHPVDIDVRGHGGYLTGRYMNKLATIHRPRAMSLGDWENMMSGTWCAFKALASDLRRQWALRVVVIEGDESLGAAFIRD